MIDDKYMIFFDYLPGNQKRHIFSLCRSDEKDDGIQHSALTACLFGKTKSKKVDVDDNV